MTSFFPLAKRKNLHPCSHNRGPIQTSRLIGRSARRSRIKLENNSKNSVTFPLLLFRQCSGMTGSSKLRYPCSCSELRKTCLGFRSFGNSPNASIPLNVFFKSDAIAISPKSASTSSINKVLFRKTLKEPKISFGSLFSTSYQKAKYREFPANILVPHYSTLKNIDTCTKFHSTEMTTPTLSRRILAGAYYDSTNSVNCIFTKDLPHGVAIFPNDIDYLTLLQREAENGPPTIFRVDQKIFILTLKKEEAPSFVTDV